MFIGTRCPPFSPARAQTDPSCRLAVSRLSLLAVYPIGRVHTSGLAPRFLQGFTAPTLQHTEKVHELAPAATEGLRLHPAPQPLWMSLLLGRCFGWWLGGGAARTCGAVGAAVEGLSQPGSRTSLLGEPCAPAAVGPWLLAVTSACRQPSREPFSACWIAALPEGPNVVPVLSAGLLEVSLLETGPELQRHLRLQR